MARLSLLIAALAVLALAGCGSNDSTGLSNILLEADLVCEGVDPDTELLMGTKNIVPVTVSNRGGVDARRFSVSVSVSWILVIGNKEFPRTDVGRATVEGLGAGSAVVVEVEFEMQDPGSDAAGSFQGTAVVDVDYRDEVSEGDEGNNICLEPILVRWNADPSTGDTIDNG
jgi:hypothetical protein